MNLIKLNKRKWDAVVDIESNKWFTGWQGDIKSEPYPIWRWDNTKDNRVETEEPPKHSISETHEIRQLSIRLEGTSRGRSSAIFVFLDESGYKYNMSMSGGEKLLKAFFADTDGKLIKRDGEYISAKFIQTKQGANYFIEVITEEK